jgi:hypothetical protein
MMHLRASTNEIRVNLSGAATEWKLEDGMYRCALRVFTYTLPVPVVTVSSRKTST